ncbi:MAG: hypothetical protein JNK48_19520 [Bryobacterales bacterium]|nr:hypothetical protein [Bryobacterales bacterium]
MNYLLHADALEAIAQGALPPDLRSTIERASPTQIHISVLAFAEILAKVELRHPPATALVAWLRRIPSEYPDRLIPITPEIAAALPNLALLAQEKGQTLSLTDGLAAAAALRFDLILIARPSPALAATGVRLLPLESPRT